MDFYPGDLEGLVSFVSSIPSGSYSFLPPLQHSDQSSEERDLMQISLLGTSVPRFYSHFLLTGGGSLYLSLYEVGGGFSCDGSARHQSKGIEGSDYDNCYFLLIE